MTRTEQLADAYEAIAKVNHYMVGIVETVTDDELDGAYELLIKRQWVTYSELRFKMLELALDLIEHEKRVRLKKAILPDGNAL